MAHLYLWQDFTDEELDQLFSKFDLNKDGTIYVDEFNTAVKDVVFGNTIEHFAKKETT